MNLAVRHTDGTRASVNSPVNTRAREAYVETIRLIERDMGCVRNDSAMPPWHRAQAALPT